MKERLGWVSNSSTSSFMVNGKELDGYEQAIEIFTDNSDNKKVIIGIGYCQYIDGKDVIVFSESTVGYIESHLEVKEKIKDFKFYETYDNGCTFTSELLLSFEKIKLYPIVKHFEVREGCTTSYLNSLIEHYVEESYNDEEE